MGELIDFLEYKRKREEEEVEALRAELKYVMDRLTDAQDGYLPLWYDVMSFPIFGDSIYSSTMSSSYELDGYDWDQDAWSVSCDSELNTWYEDD